MLTEKDEIENLIKAGYKDEDEDGKPRRLPIADGIINPALYLDPNNTKYKILWILKEPYDKDNEPPGGWSYKSFDICPKELVCGNNAHGTWWPIVYTSYGILNGFCKWEEMGDIINKETREKNEKMIETIRRIAFINIQKLPGETGSNDSEIAEAYSNPEIKTYLQQQIRDINPDIIIGGSTLKHLYDHFQLAQLVKKPLHKNRFYYFDEKRLYVDAYHPSQRNKGVDWQEEYSDSIIEAAKDWVNWKRKNNNQ
jgi:hypothetical protein